jgi:hypothetical protein
MDGFRIQASIIDCCALFNIIDTNAFLLYILDKRGGLKKLKGSAGGTFDDGRQIRDQEGTDR